MKAYIETFGCQMNEYDSERIIYYLEKKGYVKTDDIDSSDIIVINTCAVREKAQNRLYGHLGNLKSRFGHKNDPKIICVGGCTAQSLAGKIQERFPFVDIVFGTRNISQLPDLIDRRAKEKSIICSVADEGLDCRLDEARRQDPYRALVPVSIGCNNFCSYCIVPYVRGREISIDPDNIISAVSNMVSEGIVQVTLLGQNVNSYGKDLGEGMDFSYLLRRVSCVEGLKRIRFMTSHPKDISLSLIKTIGESDNIMNHIHLPLQAGSDRILKKMNRGYTGDRYMRIIEDIYNNIEDCSITTDIIVGFPGEERKDFDDTLDIVKRARFDRAFTFLYSPRQGTSAAEMEDNTPSREKKIWFEELTELQKNISSQKNSSYTGKKVKVLVEGFSPKNKDLLQGRMENNTVVIFKGKSDLIGSIVDVKIDETRSFYVRGDIEGK
jgi:tRNA-2-methylthio-N6-dimethylallyladenosine synthase